MEITPELKTRLKENDIPEDTFVRRVYRGESIEKASTRPVQEKKLDDATKKELEKRGIPYLTYYKRIKRGMPYEEAIKKPVQKKVIFSEKDKEIMKKHNVSESLAKRRLRYSTWTREKALTTPPKK